VIFWPRDSRLGRFMSRRAQQRVNDNFGASCDVDGGGSIQKVSFYIKERFGACGRSCGTKALLNAQPKTGNAHVDESSPAP
jgi:hypothetical protein